MKPPPKIILIYTAFGPPIGGLLVWLHLLAASLGGDVLQNARTSLTPGYVLAWGYGLLAFPLLAYMFGGVQAFLTGCVLKWAASAHGGFGYLWAIAAPGLVGAFAGGLLILDGGFPIDEGRIGLAVYLGALGVASSLLLRYLFRDRIGAGNNEG